MVNKITLIFILTILFSCNLSDKIINEITIADFKSLNSVEDIQLLDVRTIEEYNSGYIDGALNIDFYKFSFIDSINVIDNKVESVDELKHFSLDKYRFSEKLSSGNELIFTR